MTDDEKAALGMLLIAAGKPTKLGNAYLKVKRRFGYDARSSNFTNDDIIRWRNISVAEKFLAEES